MNNRQNQTERDIITFLDKYNMPHSNLGFLYLVRAIRIACDNDEMNHSRKVMALYQEVADSYHTTAGRVERAIRSLLKKMKLNMTNGQFIYWVTDTIQFSDGEKEKVFDILGDADSEISVLDLDGESESDITD